ncbi:MAG: ATP-binding cassette domain-containing protein, partial [Planctomycetota bacterium]
MARDHLDFHQVTFAYDSTPALFDGITLRFHGGWTGVVGPNGAGKSTILKLATGVLEPGTGRILAPDHTAYCEQRTDETPERLGVFLVSDDPEARRLRGVLGLEDDWGQRWETLSHGERKRAQMGEVLWTGPEVLAVDEPSNHLDGDARAMLFKALTSFNGIGILVSHDREFLDSLCSHCLFLEARGPVLRPGGYTKGVLQRKEEREATGRKLAKIRKERKRLENEAIDRRQEASRSHSRRSKKGLAIKDHDARAKINCARYSGKDGQAGKLYKQLDGRVRQVREAEGAVFLDKESALGIWMEGARSNRNSMFRIDGGELSLGGGRFLDLPDLSMGPEERIALTGPNGAGKSTLVRKILASLALDKDRLTYVPQEIDRAESGAVLARVR